MNKPLISVIIPVYNLASYLPKCLDSVLSQTYGELEIIPVDDGSTDDSASILQEYAQKDARVKPILKSNGGVSETRNVGLDAASGEYVFFLDGDDWLELNALERLSYFCEEFDVVQGLFVQSYDDAPDELLFTVHEAALYSREDILSYYFVNQIQESCCNKLYKRAIIGDTRFDSTLAVAEDSKFVYTVLKKARSIKLLSDITYHYYVRKDSCVHAALSEKHFDILKVSDMQREEVQDDPLLWQKFVRKYALDLFYLISCVLRDPTAQKKDHLPSLRSRTLRIKRSIFKNQELTMKFKIGVVMLWLTPGLFYTIYPKLLGKV